MGKLGVIVLALVILMSLGVSAAPGPPSPHCRFEVDVVSVDILRGRADLRVGFFIREIKPGYDLGCEEIYSGGELLENVGYSGASLRPGQKIVGNIRYFIDERSSGYSINKINILENTITPGTEGIDGKINVYGAVYVLIGILFIGLLFFCFRRK